MEVYPDPSNRQRARGVWSVMLDLQATNLWWDSVKSGSLDTLQLLDGLYGLINRGWLIQFRFYWLLGDSENCRVIDNSFCTEESLEVFRPTTQYGYPVVEGRLSI